MSTDDYPDGDFSTLKELVTMPKQAEGTNPQPTLLEIFIRIYKYLITKYDLDGFRIDTLKHLEPDFVRQFAHEIREFAASIGKKNFFIFGEVFDFYSEWEIAKFIGRHKDDTDLRLSVESQLDFPLADHLTDMIKSGRIAPSNLPELFTKRKKVLEDRVSVYPNIDLYYVTFLDNHDWNQYHETDDPLHDIKWFQRFYAPSKEYNLKNIDKEKPENAPEKRAAKLLIGLACLFTLQGIPAVYYGTEQGLEGSGEMDGHVREPLWRTNLPFSKEHTFYKALQQIAAIRREHPVLCRGQQYFRQTSQNNNPFKISEELSSQLAFSRILDDQEVVIVANMSAAPWHGRAVIDYNLNADVAHYQVLYSNKGNTNSIAPVQKVLDATIGNIRVLQLDMQPLEVQILQPVKQ